MISVIIPVYNRAGVIRQCVESVFAQTCRDYEIILVDDGSTDDLAGALAPWMDRLRYVRIANRGAAGARNEGFRHARGEYIAWLDSDDIWLPYKLEVELKIMQSLPPHVGFVHSDFACFTNEQGLISHSYVRDYFFTLDTYGLTWDALYQRSATLAERGISVAGVAPTARLYWGDVSDKVILGPLFLPSSMLMRRHCLDVAGLFNEQLPTSEDYDLLARVGRRFEVAYLDTPTLRYRRFHADQLSGDKMEILTNKGFLHVAQTLGRDDAAFYRTHTAFVDRRLSHCHYGLGVAYYRKQRYREAMKEFIASIKMNPRQRRIYLYVLAAAVLALTPRAAGEMSLKGTHG